MYIGFSLMALFDLSHVFLWLLILIFQHSLNYICKQKYVIIKVSRHYLTNNLNLLDSKSYKNIYVFFVKVKGEAENENSNRR